MTIENDIIRQLWQAIRTVGGNVAEMSGHTRQSEKLHNVLLLHCLLHQKCG